MKSDSSRYKNSNGDNVVGTRMRHIRMLRKLRQKEVADKLLISLSHYSKVEVGINQPSMEMMERFCEVFDINLDWLAAGVGKPISGVGEQCGQYANDLLTGDGGQDAIQNGFLEDIADEIAALLADVQLEKIRRYAAELSIPEETLLRVMVRDRLFAKFGHNSRN